MIARVRSVVILNLNIVILEERVGLNSLSQQKWVLVAHHILTKLTINLL